MRSIILTTTLLLSRVASAETTAPVEPTGDGKADDPGAAPVLPDPDVLAPRQGFHMGFGVGGAYLAGLDVMAGVLRMELNACQQRMEYRFSPLFYYASESVRTSMGLGLLLQSSYHFNSRYMLSAGALIAIHHSSPDSGEGYTTLALGATASPVTLRFGAKRNVEVGLQIMILREFEFGTVNPAGYFSFSYLAL